MHMDETSIPLLWLSLQIQFVPIPSRSRNQFSKRGQIIHQIVRIGTRGK